MNPEVCPYDTVCFHAQQCAEKYIKALLINLGIDFPKTHDISSLTKLLPEPFLLGVSVQDQDQLTEYATVSRYPEEVNTLTSKDAGWAMAIAHQIRDAVRVRLPKNALQQI
jgi:HEPN domain-containing protein